MHYDFVKEEQRFYSIFKSIDFSGVKDENTKAAMLKLQNMIMILKELLSNERRSINRSKDDE